MSEKTTKVNEEIPVDLYNVLMDENNVDPITLYDGEGKKLSFEQVAIIPYADKTYAILTPLDKLPGISDDEAIVFSMETTENGETVLQVEGNEDVANSVYGDYLNLYKTSAFKKSNNKKKSKERDYE